MGTYNAVTRFDDFYLADASAALGTVAAPAALIAEPGSAESRVRTAIAAWSARRARLEQMPDMLSGKAIRYVAGEGGPLSLADSESDGAVKFDFGDFRLVLVA